MFAIVTAVFAVLAFRKQSREVSDQAKMLEVQSDQLGEDRTVNAEQIRVLKLQAEELRRHPSRREPEFRARTQRTARIEDAAIWDPPTSGRKGNADRSPVSDSRPLNGHLSACRRM